MAANDIQVGGDHYNAMGDFQPWEVMRHWLTPEEYRGYQKGVAIAYLAREGAKGGTQDIKKAAHHLQKLLEVLAEQPVASVPAEQLAQPVAVQSSSAASLVASSSPLDSSWALWDGGSQPVPDGTLVEVQLRAGALYTLRAGPQSGIGWQHSTAQMDNEVVAYRLL